MFTLLSSTVRQVTPCQNDDAYCSLATVIGSGATTAIGPLALAVHSSDSTGQLRLMTRRLPVPNAGSADDIRLEEFGVVNTPPRERLRCVSGLCLANGTMPENAKLAAQECRTSTPDQYAALRSSSKLGERLSSEHLRLISILDQCRSAADQLDQLGPEERIVQVRRLYGRGSGERHPGPLVMLGRGSGERHPMTDTLEQTPSILFLVPYGWPSSLGSMVSVRKSQHYFLTHWPHIFGGR